MVEEYVIEELIEQASHISNAELFDVLEDDEELTFVFNDYLNKEDEFVRDIVGHFDGFKDTKFVLYNKEKPLIIECSLLKSKL